MTLKKNKKNSSDAYSKRKQCWSKDIQLTHYEVVLLQYLKGEIILIILEKKFSAAVIHFFLGLAAG